MRQYFFSIPTNQIPSHPQFVLFHFGTDWHSALERSGGVEKIQGSFSAFAAILADGHVVTWGDPTAGGDSSTVQNQLHNVRDIQA